MGIDINRLGIAAQKQILHILGEQKKTKYKNTKAERIMQNGQTYVFDSQKEAKRYDELAMLLKLGKIRKLRLQEQFTLQESYIDENGDRVRAIKYVADFTYEAKHCIVLKTVDGTEAYAWKKVVEDVKGVRTDKYKLKKKMMQERFGIVIQEV